MVEGVVAADRARSALARAVRLDWQRVRHGVGWMRSAPPQAGQAQMRAVGRTEVVAGAGQRNSETAVRLGQARPVRPQAEGQLPPPGRAAVGDGSEVAAGVVACRLANQDQCQTYRMGKLYGLVWRTTGEGKLHGTRARMEGPQSSGVACLRLQRQLKTPRSATAGSRRMG